MAERHNHPVRCFCGSLPALVQVVIRDPRDDWMMGIALIVSGLYESQVFEVDCSAVGIKDNSADCSTARSSLETAPEIVRVI
jgi:hypothetical protein